MAMFRVGMDVEVQQDSDDPGLRGAWYTATIIRVEKRIYTVEYHEIYKEPEEAGVRDTEVVPLSRLRPIYPDDSRNVPLERRTCGEPVDCWYNDGWWEGYVHITKDTEVVVIFPEGDGDEVTVPLDQSHVEKENERRRLRTRRKWSFKDREWTSVIWKSWPGSGDERTTGRADAPGNTAGRATAGDRAVREPAKPQVAAGAGAAADLPNRTASQAIPLERAASRAEVLQRAASAVGLREAAPSHAAMPFPQPAPSVSKDIFEQKQRELDQQRGRKKASRLPAFDCASDDSDDDAMPKEIAKKGSAQGIERVADVAAGQKNKAIANKSDLELKVHASKNAAQKLDKACNPDVKAAIWTADANADLLGKATVLGGPPSELAQKKHAEAQKGARTAPQRTHNNASKGASATPQQNQDAKGTAKGHAAKKGAAVVPQGLKKRPSAAKKDAGGAETRTGAVAKTPEEEEEEAMKWMSKEGWKPITNVDKDKPWTAEELDIMFTVEGKVEDMMVRRYVMLKLLPCRDLYSHRKARSAHSAKLYEIRATAFPAAAAAGPGGKNAPQQRPVQRQQSLQQKSQQLQQLRQLHVKSAAPSSRPGPDAIAAADSPREQAAAPIKGAGAKGDDASLPSSPKAAADTCPAAQACRGKPKVTEIFGKGSVLAPTLAQLEQKNSRLSSQGLGGMPDWDAPAAQATGKGRNGRAEPRAVTAVQRGAQAAAEQKAAPQPLKTEQMPQQCLPTDPRLRFSQTNRASEVAPESNMPKAEGAQMNHERSHPDPSPHGDVHMSDDFGEPLPSSEPDVKVDTSKPRRRERSPENRNHAPEMLPDFPPIKRPRTRLGAIAEPGSPSNIICLDNIGAVFKSNKELEAALRPFVPDFTKVEIAREVVEGMPCLGGWAAVFFPSAQDAAEYFSTMQNLYLKTSASPLPRPLLAHYPRKSSEDFWRHVNYGFSKGIFVAPHFAQPNSIEFDPALRWRHLQRSLADVKRRQREAHAADLAEVMQAYQKEVGAEEASADKAPPPPPLKSAWLFVKGVGGPALADMQVIRSAFDQWGVRDIRVLRDPATHQLRGIALVRLNDAHQVELLKGDMDEMVYIMAGSPRPVEAYMLDTGLPRECWQAVYDSALFQVFKRDDRGNGPVEPPGAAPPRLLEIEQNRARSLEEWYSLRLRVLAERGFEERLQLQQDLVEGQRFTLHLAHTRQFDQEMAKLIDAYRMNCTPVMQQQRSNKRPIKPLRNLPERYKYLMHNGQVRMARQQHNPAAVGPADGSGVATGNGQIPAQRASVAPPGAAGRGRPNAAGAVGHMPLGRGMTMCVVRDRAKPVPRRQTAKQARRGRGHQRGGQ